MKLHKTIANAFGYELIKRKKHPTVTSHIINLIKHYKIDLILDVGANCGQFGSMLRKNGYSGDIHSFEPVSKTYNELQQAAGQDSNWHTHQFALGENCGEETVNISESSDLSSFLDSNDFGKQQFKKINVTQTEKVTISTVHHFLVEKIANHDKRRIFLKMDTQGYDLKVFQGALSQLAQIHCMLSELSFMPIYSGMPHYLQALKIYEDAGFKVTGLYPISRNENLSIIEMDCIMAKS